MKGPQTSLMGVPSVRNGNRSIVMTMTGVFLSL